MSSKRLSSSKISVPHEADALPKRNQRFPSNSTKKFIISDSDDSDVPPTPVERPKLQKNDERKASVSSPHGEWIGPDFKSNLKPLGFDDNLMKWIESTKENSIFSSGVTHAQKDKLEQEKSDLKDLQIELLEKFYSAFNSIPTPVLSQFPEFDERVFQKLSILRGRVKAKRRQTEKKLQRFGVADGTKNSFGSSETSTDTNQSSNCNVESDKSNDSDVMVDNTNSSKNYCTLYSVNSTLEQSNSTATKITRQNAFQLKFPVKSAISVHMAIILEDMRRKKLCRDQNTAPKSIVNGINCPTDDAVNASSFTLTSTRYLESVKQNPQKIDENRQTTATELDDRILVGSGTARSSMTFEEKVSERSENKFVQDAETEGMTTSPVLKKKRIRKLHRSNYYPKDKAKQNDFRRDEERKEYMSTKNSEHEEKKSVSSAHCDNERSPSSSSRDDEKDKTRSNAEDFRKFIARFKNKYRSCGSKDKERSKDEEKHEARRSSSQSSSLLAKRTSGVKRKVESSNEDDDLPLSAGKKAKKQSAGTEKKEMAEIEDYEHDVPDEVRF